MYKFFARMRSFKLRPQNQSYRCNFSSKEAFTIVKLKANYCQILISSGKDFVRDVR
jgi:hypothetical protein